MNAGKSLEILKIANNYREQGKNVLIFTPVVDDRYGVGKVTSRIGISKDAIMIREDVDVYEITKTKNNKNKISCILVDESQFLNKVNVLDLIDVVDSLNIPVICYGLKNDFRNELFLGTKWLLIYADKIEEVKTVCWYCNRKATMILKYDKNDNPIYTGEQIEIGGNETYKSVCRKHYFSPERKEMLH